MKKILFAFVLIAANSIYAQRIDLGYEHENIDSAILDLYLKMDFTSFESDGITYSYSYERDTSNMILSN